MPIPNRKSIPAYRTENDVTRIGFSMRQYWMRQYRFPDIFRKDFMLGLAIGWKMK